MDFRHERDQPTEKNKVIIQRCKIAASTLVGILLLILISCGHSKADGTPNNDARVRELYLRAVSGLPDPQTVHMIATSQSTDTVKYLTLVASTLQADSGNRLAAIDELGRIGSPEAGEGLARLLAPHYGVAMRLRATQALSKSQCMDQCIEAILFYLYRLSVGDTAMRDQALEESAQRGIDDKQKEVLSSIDTLLVQHKKDVIAVLSSKYGLGTDEPSPFSLETVGRLRLQEACDALFKSQEYQQTLSKYTKSSPDHTTAAVKQIGCPTQQNQGK